MKTRATTEEFINKARTVHGDRYDYSEVNYAHSQSKVRIKCKEHGVFEQSPANHLFGKGCVKCNGYKRFTVEQFIEKARETHGDRFDYSNVEYSSIREKVVINCRLHGEFLQTPSSHLMGRGCPKCLGMLKSEVSAHIQKDFPNLDLSNVVFSKKEE